MLGSVAEELFDDAKNIEKGWGVQNFNPNHKVGFHILI